MAVYMQKQQKFADLCVVCGKKMKKGDLIMDLGFVNTFEDNEGIREPIAEERADPNS